MKLEYFGHSCFALRLESGKVLITDPFDASVTYAPCTEACDIALVSHDHFDHNHTHTLRGDFAVVKTPGEHIFGDVKITGVETCHDPEGGSLRGKNNIYIVEAEGLRIAHLGDMGHIPDADQMAALQGLDVMLIPVGGTFTIDTPQAEALIAAAKPRMAIAMHYLTEDYEIPITTPEKFIADMQAASLPRVIEITKDNISAMPHAAVMAYK